MTITFREIPADYRVPGTYIEVDDSRSGALGSHRQRSLVIGVNGSTATVANDLPVMVSSPSDAEAKFGADSMVAAMADAFFDNYPSGELWACGVADPTGVAAAGEMKITGAATKAGVLVFTLMGRRYAVAVASGDAATKVGTAVAKAINDDASLPFAAVNTTGTVAITFAYNGTAANSLQGPALSTDPAEALPAGIVAVPKAVTGGTGVPDFTAAVAAFPARHFHTIADGCNAAPAAALLDKYQSDAFQALVGESGAVFRAGREPSLSNATTLLDAGNSKHAVVLTTKDSPTPSWIWAAALAARDAQASDADPAAPRTGARLSGCVLGPSGGWGRSDRNTLLHHGGATYRDDGAGNPEVERIVTTYTTKSGAPDTTWSQIQTLRTVEAIRAAWLQWIGTRYQNYKLANNGTVADEGANVVTPNTIKAEAVAFYMSMQRRGICEPGQPQLDAFKKGLRAERDSTDVTRVNALMTPDLLSPLYIVATKLSFTL